MSDGCFSMDSRIVADFHCFHPTYLNGTCTHLGKKCLFLAQQYHSRPFVLGVVGFDTCLLACLLE
jgi:hypothetical protein